MADVTADGSYTNMTSIAATDRMLIVDDGTTTLQDVAISVLTAYIAASVTTSPVQGGLINGYISRTVSSNNLIIAIKTLAGADPSAGDAVTVRIGNSLRTITAALSVTVTAGTDIFGFNASGALSDQDLFVYLGYRAAGPTVFIGVSRIPFGVTYANFSATTTAQTYLIYSGSAPASTDEVENIGRVNATTSGTAAYNWSVPATSIVISRPIFTTRTLAWVPTAGGHAVGDGTQIANYSIDNRYVDFEYQLTLGGTSSVSGDYTITVPLTPSLGFTQLIALFDDNASTNYNAFASTVASTLYVRAINVAGTYPTASTQLSGTVPFTWATSDVVRTFGRYRFG